MNKIIGRFYFKQTQQGNLIGEFSNNLSISNLTECANLIEVFGDLFVGKYNSCWFENGVNSLMLTITFKGDTNNNIYSLIWQNANNETIFWGEGFIVDNVLIGDYRNFEK